MLARLRLHYGAKAWWGALVMRTEMKHLGGMIEQTYMPILRLVADDAAAIQREWEAVKASRRPIRRFASPHTRWKVKYGNFVRELDWAYAELHARLAQPDFEELVVSTMCERVDAWVGGMKRRLAELNERSAAKRSKAKAKAKANDKAKDTARSGSGRANGLDRVRNKAGRASARMLALTSPIVGDVEMRGVEDGALAIYIPDCAMHKVVSDTEPQTYACLYGCKAAFEAYMGPNDPMTITFEPNLPAFDCVMRVRLGRSSTAATA